MYGAEIPKAIMKLFESQKVRDLASKLNIHIPEYKLQSFVQKKMFKVKDLVQAARALGTCDGPASRLEAFVDEALSPRWFGRAGEGRGEGVAALLELIGTLPDEHTQIRDELTRRVEVRRSRVSVGKG